MTDSVPVLALIHQLPPAVPVLAQIHQLPPAVPVLALVHQLPPAPAVLALYRQRCQLKQEEVPPPIRLSLYHRVPPLGLSDHDPADRVILCPPVFAGGLCLLPRSVLS